MGHLFLLPSLQSYILRYCAQKLSNWQISTATKHRDSSTYWDAFGIAWPGNQYFSFNRHLMADFVLLNHPHCSALHSVLMSYLLDRQDWINVLSISPRTFSLSYLSSLIVLSRSYSLCYISPWNVDPLSSFVTWSRRIEKRWSRSTIEPPPNIRLQW